MKMKSMLTAGLALVLFGLGCGAPAALALKLDGLIDQKTLEQVGQNLAPAEGGIPLVGDVSDADEQALGREIAGRMLSAAPLVQDEALQKYVNRVGEYVARQSGRPGLAWTFGVVASDDINAFAAPGGYILVTRGLYRTLHNEAELAGVLGHEIAHVNERHHIRLLQKTRLLEKGTNLVAARAGSETVKALAGNGAELYARSLDKDAEFACDRLGIEYAARAGYEPFAYIEALDRLGASDQSDQLALLYKTHPHPAERIDALYKAIGNRWDRLGGVVPTRWVAVK